MSTTIERRTPMELYRLGVAALDQALGPVESLRFLRLLDPGSGDYTVERQTQIDRDSSSVAELSAAIRANRPSP